MKSLRFFKPKEFQCKCGKCGLGYGMMDEKLLRMLDELREKAGIPIVIGSAYRCKEHNDAISEAVEDSAHLKGKAVDIRCNDSATRFKILKAAFEVGFRRIEPRETWVHVDVDESKPQDVVFYR